MFGNKRVVSQRGPMFEHTVYAVKRILLKGIPSKSKIVPLIGHSHDHAIETHSSSSWQAIKGALLFCHIDYITLSFVQMAETRLRKRLHDGIPPTYACITFILQSTSSRQTTTLRYTREARALTFQCSSRYHLINVALHTIVTAQLVCICARILLLELPQPASSSHSLTLRKQLPPRKFQVCPGTERLCF